MCKGTFVLKTALNPYGAVGFGLASSFAVLQEWSLPEFCWSTWLSGLIYTWSCVITAAIHIILTARSDKATYAQRFRFLQRIPPYAFLFCMTVISVSIGLIAFRMYSFLFAFYGLFLSVFSEMEPLSLFGRNGFINSDFFTPVMHLLESYWPMALGALIANWKDLFRENPWKRVLFPLQKEILRMHVLTLALPFLSLIVWALFGEAYHFITIVLLMSLFYLLPKKTQNKESDIKENTKLMI